MISLGGMQLFTACEFEFGNICTLQVFVEGTAQG